MMTRAALPVLDTLNPEALKALVLAQHQARDAGLKILLQREQLLSQSEQLAWREADNRAAEAAHRQAAADAGQAPVE